MRLVLLLLTFLSSLTCTIAQSNYSDTLRLSKNTKEFFVAKGQPVTIWLKNGIKLSAQFDHLSQDSLTLTDNGFTSHFAIQDIDKFRIVPSKFSRIAGQGFKLAAFGSYGMAGAFLIAGTATMISGNIWGIFLLVAAPPFGAIGGILHFVGGRIQGRKFRVGSKWAITPA